MKSLISLVLSGALLVSCGEAIAKPKKQPKLCNYPVEENSVITKQFFYPKFGISMELPQNLVSMLRNDGSIEILDRGTYKVLQCPPAQRLGMGYMSYVITWADKSIEYKKRIIVKDGVDLLLNSELVGIYYSYSMILRATNGRGQEVDIYISVDDGITNHNFREYLKEYMELGTKVISYGGSDR